MTNQLNMIPSGRYWHVQHFEQLSTTDLYRLLAARVDVFVVEQACPYPELDGLDPIALHIRCMDSDQPEAGILAYARVLPPGTACPEATIGRVLTTQAGRNQGLARAVMQLAIQTIADEFGQTPIKISAQQYLEGFYRSLGFETMTEIYLEDGIEHVGMIRHISH